MEDYVRVLQLIGKLEASGFNVRPIKIPDFTGSGQHPWSEQVAKYRADSSRFETRIIDPATHLGWAASRPAGGNDGFLWQGRGLATNWRAGAYIRYAAFSAALRPAVAAIQNAEFDAGPGSPFHYFRRPNIDVPRRFGSEAFVQMDPGQSYAELNLWGGAVGASTASMWWGPATQNPIIMSNNAPGFGHLYVGTFRPIDAGIFDFSGKWFWGNLYESAYFDENAQNDRRFITALVVDIQPHFVRNLHLGGTRVFVQSTEQEATRFQDFLIVFQSPLKADLEDSHDDYGFDKNDQMVSGFARWDFPESGFGVYTEIARGDHSRNLRHLLVQLRFATGYTIGLNKVIRLDNYRLIDVNAELTRLEASRSDVVRSGVRTSITNFYVNTIVRQGYTHRGQVVGAAIGPGSNSQHISADLYAPWGKLGWFGKRIVYDNDLFYAVTTDPSAHQVEFITGLDFVRFLGPFEVVGDLSLRRFLNLYYEPENDFWNFTASAGLRWLIGSHR